MNAKTFIKVATVVTAEFDAQKQNSKSLNVLEMWHLSLKFTVAAFS
jgi:hypothetical protein